MEFFLVMGYSSIFFLIQAGFSWFAYHDKDRAVKMILLWSVSMAHLFAALGFSFLFHYGG